MNNRNIPLRPGRFLTALLLLHFFAGQVWAAPFLEKTTLFEAGTDGYKLYRIPGIVVTARGTVLAYCEARKKTGSDWDTIDIRLRRSTDGGKTWGPPQSIPEVPGPKPRSPVALALKLGKPDDVTYNNPVMITDRKGGVHLLFCLDYARCFYTRSDDDGASFGPPVEITGAFDTFRPEYDWHVLATGPGHGIELNNGRFVVPVWLSTGKVGHGPSLAATIFSDDHGKTWQRGDLAVPNSEEQIDPNETAIVQLADGRVLLNTRSRSQANLRLVTRSPDGATGWSTPRFDAALPEPICEASLVRFSQRPAGDKNRILFANPDNLSRADGKEKPGGGRDRKNLSVRLSYDEGETWAVKKSLEPGFSAYSDLAVLENGTVLCFYECQKPAGQDSPKKGLLAVARFNLEWLTDGKDSGGLTAKK